MKLTFLQKKYINMFRVRRKVAFKSKGNFFLPNFVRTIANSQPLDRFKQIF